MFAQKNNTMITTRFYQDTRVEKKDGYYPIRIRLTNNRKSTTFETGIKTKKNWWDGAMITKEDSNHRAKNIRLRELIDEIDRIVYSINPNLDVAEIRKIIEDKTGRKTKRMNFVDIIDEFVKTKEKWGTAKVYITTKNKIEEYDPDATFETITHEWLLEYEKKMLADGLKVNFIAIQMRNIRAVFNYAIEREYTTLYPFRRYKIKREQTEKRSLTIEQVRELLNYPCEEYQEKYRDMFMLMIYMIGINSVDLFKMPPLKSNRISYIRQKTDKERASNVRRIEFTLQPEAEEIIKKYAGKNYMLDVMDTYNNHVDFTHRMNLGLQKMGELKRVGRGGKKIITPAFPGITSYWARHTWATLAAELEIPKETIGAALGHAGTSVTDIYINFDRKKIDEANRKVINYILGK